MVETAQQLIRRPSLVKLGSRSVSPLGYRIDLVEQHLKDHLSWRQSKRWCSTDCLARTMFGRNTALHRDGIRRRLPRTFRSLLQRGLFLVIEYKSGPGSHGEALACKLYENSAETERQYASTQLDRMRLRHEVSTETLERAAAVLGISTPQALTEGA